ncbi:MAG: 3D domain-containing protein [Desulfobacterales bacterium]|nr:3D domain-containing protein [Desulfobacterales bacterium]
MFKQVSFYIIVTILVGAMISLGQLYKRTDALLSLNKDLVGIVVNLDKKIRGLEVLTVQDISEVTITAYTPSVDETDSDPMITASMKRVRPGSIAVSRDLFKAGWVFGKKVYIQGEGVFVILDLMHDRWEKRIDIVLFSKKDARKFGIKRDIIAALLKI